MLKPHIAEQTAAWKFAKQHDWAQDAYLDVQRAMICNLRDEQWSEEDQILHVAMTCIPATMGHIREFAGW